MPNQYQRKRLPYGFYFLDVAETKRLKSTSLNAEKILEEHEYQPVKPATIDFQKTFEVFGREDMFHFRDHLGDHLALRNDVTIQIIKGFCNQLETKDIKDGISRYYYNVPIFTDVKKNYPALREVQQLGAEIIGANSEEAVSEVVQLASKILNKAFLIPHKLVLGDIRILNFIKSSFSHTNLHDMMMKKDRNQLISAMMKEGWDKKTASLFSRNILYCKGDTALDDEMKELQKNIQGEKKIFIATLREMFLPLFKLKQKLEQQSLSVDIDPLLMRQPKYYTSFLFEGYISGFSSPPLRGGSYDKLISEYSSQQIPASGFALDVSSLLQQNSFLL